MGVGIAVLLAGLFGQLQIIRASYALGGHEWSQGDWLINFAAGPIRRGVFGEGLLRLSDWSGVSPLALVVALQASLAVALFLGTALLLLQQSRPWMVLAIVNPGIFAIVWIVDPISGGRKELFALLALLLVALPGGGLARHTISAALITIGALGHEVNALLFPAWAAFLFLFPPSYARPARLALILAAALPVAVGAAFSVLYVRVPDSAPVCGALVARGLGAAELCGGAIAWLSDPENGFAKVAGALARSENLALVPVGWLLCAIPLYRLLRVGAVGRSGLLVVAAGVLPILLLYPVGLDWGRWLAVQVTVTAFVAMGLGARGQLAQQPGIGPRELALWLLSAASWAPLHGPDIGFPGLLAILF